MRIALGICHTKARKGAVNKKYDLNEHDEGRALCYAIAGALQVRNHDVHIFTGSLTDKIGFINAGDFDVAMEPHFNADIDHLDPFDENDSRGYGCMVMHCPKARNYRDAEISSIRGRQADMLSEHISQRLAQKDRGGRAGWYWGKLDARGHPTDKDAFLSDTACPAFIPEFGYIDNNHFCKEWLVPKRYDELAEALAEAMEKLW